MLFALLFDEQDRMVAAAPAAEQQPMGQRYWRDVHPQGIAAEKDWQTAVVDVIDQRLIEKLNSLALDDAELAECRLAIDVLIGVGDDGQDHSGIRAA